MFVQWAVRERDCVCVYVYKHINIYTYLYVNIQKQISKHRYVDSHCSMSATRWSYKSANKQLFSSRFGHYSVDKSRHVSYIIAILPG